VRVIVLAVGRLRPPFVDDVAHYAKLLGRYARLELIEVREDSGIAARIPERAFVSLLDASGQQLDSIAFSAFLEQRRASGRDLCFVIGGAFGGLELQRTDHRLSLGAITMAHQLARVVLLEQVYRGHKILAGEPYHH
jgi:23S rRNA (pseudouridine1915-N3)-methyltransferase